MDQLPPERSPALKRVIPFPSAGTASKFILSVDDEPVILATRQEILRRAGYRVFSAANGNDALTFFNSQFVDLVLLDYRMPEFDGGAIAQEMKKRKPKVPVIVVSAYIHDLESVSCADCFVVKGGNPAVLLA
jgi:CheY-like chemotaxis protein